MQRLGPLTRRMSRSAEDVHVVVGLVEDAKYPSTKAKTLNSKPANNIWIPRKSLPEGQQFLNEDPWISAVIRGSIDHSVETGDRPYGISALVSQRAQPVMKKADQKISSSNNETNKQTAARTSPLVSKKSLPLTHESGNLLVSAGTGGTDNIVKTGASSEDVADSFNDVGTEVFDGGEGNSKKKQVIQSVEFKIEKTKEAIKKEQSVKEEIVNEYLQVSADKPPTARIKALFEKKNQKSAQNIVYLQRKLETYQQRLLEVQTHGVIGHRQAKEMLRDVGQGINTIVSKPKEFAHHIKNKFGSADNIAQLNLDSPSGLEPTSNGKSGVRVTTSLKYPSDDEASSVTSGSVHKAAGTSPTHSVHADGSLAATLNQALTDDLKKIKDMSQNVSNNLMVLVQNFEKYKVMVEADMSLLRCQLEDERYKVDRMNDQLIDLAELHQHEMLNTRQDLASMEEKIEYRLEERTTDLSDLMDNVTARILRLEQQQQQQQILSMEMVENATFRTIISKLINVVLAVLAVILVLVSTTASLLSPFFNSVSRLLVSIATLFLSWLVYQNSFYIQELLQSVWNILSWPWR